MFVAAQINCDGTGNLEPDVRDGSFRYAIPAIDGSDIRSVQMHAIRQNQQLAQGELSRTEMRSEVNERSKLTLSNGPRRRRWTANRRCRWPRSSACVPPRPRCAASKTCK